MGNLEENVVSFEGKVAFVTGGSRGIGREIALQLAIRGADVAIVGRNADHAAETLRDIAAHGREGGVYRCDVSSYEDVESAVKSALEDFGSIDFLVNNAGIVRDKLLLRMSPEDWDRVISINLTGVYNVVKAVAPHFLKRRLGRIVNISSVIGIIGNAGQANYAASKAGIIGLTKALAKEFASRGITVNTVAPGYIETGMTKNLSEDSKDKMLDMIPLRRFGTALDVAGVVVFLLSDMADYITGQVINCDGGMVTG
jgi:3-oxoacyl-[acyl-carrier protein] reductase